MDILSKIQSLRVTAFFLFLIPALALIGSLLAHNALVSYRVHHEILFDVHFDKIIPGKTSQKIECNDQNGYCSKINKSANRLDQCNKYHVNQSFIDETGKNYTEDLAVENEIKKLNKKIFVQYEITNKINEVCILNTKLMKYYEFAPIIFEKIYKLKINKKTSLGTNSVVNPIMYGETSISNIVKRFPIKLIFKPLMYLSAILMILYWYYNNLILNYLQNTKVKNNFFIFGVLSSIFLILHVIFLGWVFESEILTKLRRSFIVFFILFEVLAQAFLIKNILKIKSEISKYLNTFIMYSKLVFVSGICFATLVILLILVFVNLDSKVDYILEWNYFLILLFFYLLSFMMWRKKI